jgi:hypothetical protein
MQLDKAVNAALKIEIDSVKEFVKRFFASQPLFWLESDSDGTKLVETLKESKLYKRF